MLELQDAYKYNKKLVEAKITKCNEIDMSKIKLMMNMKAAMQLKKK